MKIQDGTGSGFSAKVDSSNGLLVKAVTVPEVTSISSNDGATYTIDLERTLLAATTFEDIGHFEYTGELKLQVDLLIVSREDVALDSAGQALIRIIKDAPYTSGGDPIIPANINLGSSNKLDSTVYSGTTTIVTDKTAEVPIIDVAFNDNYDVDLKGALILNKGDSITIEGKSKNIGDILHVIMTVFEVKEVI